MLFMFCRVLGEDDDIIHESDADDIQVLTKDVIHKVLEHGKCVRWSLGADQVLIMALPTPEGCLLLTPLLDSHLVIGIAQVLFGEDLGEVESVEHL